MPEPLTIDVSGRKVAALAWGPKAGRRVLALHGWLDNAASFSALAPLLEGCHVVAVDLPGHGHSDWMEAEGSLFVQWVPEVAAIADGLQWERFVLLGHSMGAGIATLYAGTQPQRVEKLIAIEGLGPMVDPPELTPERVEMSLRSRGRWRGRTPPVYQSIEVAAARVVEGVAGMTAEGARVLVERGTRPIEGGVTWRADPRLRGRSIMRLSEDQVRAFTARIAAPTLVIRASDGWPFPTDMIRGRFETIPNARLVELAGGHHLHLTDPDATSVEINRFLSDS